MSFPFSTARLPAVLALLCLFVLPFDRAQALTITLHGRVTSHVTGLPIEGARVSAYVKPRGEGGDTESAADGSYTLVLDVTPTAESSGTVYVSATGYVNAARPFALEPSVEMDFAMRNYGSVSGTVRHRVTGQALDIVVVSTTQFDGEHWKSVERDWTSGGSYHISLAPDDYRICAGGIGSGFARQCFDGVDIRSADDLTAATPIGVVDRTQVDGIDLRVAEGTHLSGTVRDERTGQPLAFKQLYIELYDSNGILIDETNRINSDEAGKYELDGIPDGTFYLTADIYRGAMRGKQLYPGIPCPSGTCPAITNGQAIVVSGGNPVEGIDFTFGPVATLQGMVKDRATSAPLGGVRIVACTASDLILWPDCYSGTSTDDGRYQVDLDRGYYLIYTETPSTHADMVYPDLPCVAPVCQRSTAPRFTVSAGDALSGYDFALSASSKITGTVVDDVTGEPSSAALAVFDSNYRFLWSFYSSEGGPYTSPKMPGGTYYVAAYYQWGGRCTFYRELPCPASATDRAAIAAINPTPIVIADGGIAAGVDFRVPLERPVFSDGFDPSASP